MNYKKHYDLLIAKAKSRSPIIGYSESHHIIPRCLGGSNLSENLVRLTADEHFVSHQLLVKIYPENRRLKKAVHFMTIDHNGKRINNKEYSWLKKLHQESMIGENNPMYGKPLSEDHIEKIRIAKRGKKKSKEHCEKMRESQKDIPKTKEHCKAISISKRKPHDEKQVEKRRGVNKEQEREIYQMRKKGYSVKKLNVLYNITVPIIYKILGEQKCIENI